MPKFVHKPSRAYLLKMSAAGRKSQAIQAAKRESEITPEMLMDMMANPPLREGDVVHVLQWSTIQTGVVLRWAFVRGPRRNNFRMRASDGRVSKPHGMAWFMDHLRPIFLTH